MSESQRKRIFTKEEINRRALASHLPINQYDKNMNFIKRYESVTEAMNILKNKHISEVCKGKRKTACGYIFKYAIKK